MTTIDYDEEKKGKNDSKAKAGMEKLGRIAQEELVGRCNDPPMLA